MFSIDRSDAAIPSQQRAFLSTLWIFVLLNVLVRDVHHFLAEGFLEEIMTRPPLSEPFLLAAGVLMQIPLLMVALPRILPDRALRIVNTIAASLTLLVIAAQVVFGQPDADDLLFAAVETVALIAILRATRSRTISSADVQKRPIQNRPIQNQTRQTRSHQARAHQARAHQALSLTTVPYLTLPCLALVSLVATTPAAAQQRGDFEVGLGIAALELEDKLSGETGMGLDGRIGYFVTDRFQLEIQHSSASAILDGSFEATTLNALYYFGKTRRFISPYGLIGVGRADVRLDDLLDSTDDQTDDTNAFRAALGARFDLGTNDRTSMRIELSALREEAFGEAATHFGVSSTFLWRLGDRGPRKP